MKLLKLIIRNSKYLVDENKIHDEMELIEDFGMDSISCIQLTVDIEKEFKISFDDQHLNIEMIKTYGKLKNYILSKIQS
ncbi:MAG: acyl carrier protein [Clostridiales bacterium]